MFSAVSGFTCSALLNPLTPHSHASFVLGSGVSRQRSAADNRLMCLAWLSAVKAYSVTNENVILSRFLVNGSTVRVELSEWRLHNSHRQACAQRSHAGRPIVLLGGPKKGFSPRRGDTLVKRWWKTFPSILHHALFLLVDFELFWVTPTISILVRNLISR